MRQYPSYAIEKCEDDDVGIKSSKQSLTRPPIVQKVRVILTECRIKIDEIQQAIQNRCCTMANWCS